MTCGPTTLLVVGGKGRGTRYRCHVWHLKSSAHPMNGCQSIRVVIGKPVYKRSWQVCMVSAGADGGAVENRYM